MTYYICLNCGRILSEQDALQPSKCCEKPLLRKTNDKDPEAYERASHG